MYWYGRDPQLDVGHPCAICGCEMFGENEICQRCQDRMMDNEEDY